MAANEKPAEELVPNAETVAAMTDAREGRVETVTLAQLQAAIDEAAEDGKPKRES